MIKVNHLAKKYDEQQVLADITFEAQPGELIAVIGASGSGKTTLFRCLTLRERWTSGKYYYDEKDVFASIMNRVRVRKDFAYLEQQPVLFPTKTALKNVLIEKVNNASVLQFLTRFVRSDDHMDAMDAIEKVGLLDKAYDKAEKLSGGERQRIGLARAMVHGAKVIVADEPVTGLAPNAAEEVLRDMNKLCKEQGLTVFCTLNQLEWAERFSTRILGLSEGRIELDIRSRKLTMRERDMIFG